MTIENSEIILFAKPIWYFSFSAGKLVFFSEISWIIQHFWREKLLHETEDDKQASNKIFLSANATKRVKWKQFYLNFLPQWRNQNFTKGKSKLQIYHNQQMFLIFTSWNVNLINWLMRIHMYEYYYFFCFKVFQGHDEWAGRPRFQAKSFVAP